MRVAAAFRIPLRIPFRGVTSRDGLLLHGPHGWGEFSPFPEYGPEIAARWAAAALEAAEGPAWPPPRRERIPVNVTVPAVDPARARAIVAESGCTAAKVKVGDAGDEARLEAVRDALGPAGRIRIDVNGAWEPDDAARRIRVLARYGLEYVEQPVRTVEELARLRRLVDVPLAADESIRLGDPRRVRDLEAADVAVLKVQPLGGVWAALEVAEMLELPAVVSSALETSIGIAAGLALAAALPELPHACGLGTVPMLEGDLVTDPLVPVDGAIAVRRPVPDPGMLDRFAPEPADRARIERRLEEARGARAVG